MKGGLEKALDVAARVWSFGKSGQGPTLFTGEAKPARKPKQADPIEVKELYGRLVASYGESINDLQRRFLSLSSYFNDAQARKLFGTGEEEALKGVLSLLHQPVTLDRALEAAMSASQEFIPVDSASLFVPNSADQLVFRLGENTPQAFVDLRINPGSNTPMRRAYDSGEMKVLKGSRQGRRYSAQSLVVPVVSVFEGAISSEGVMNYTNHSAPGVVTNYDLAIAKVFAYAAGIVCSAKRIENHVLDGLKAIVGEDPKINNHSENVAEVAYGLARSIGLPDEEVQSLLLACSLHDFGLVGKNVTLPSDRVNHDVYRHAERGARLLSDFKSLPRVRQIGSLVGVHHSGFGNLGPCLMAGEDFNAADVLRVSELYQELTEDGVKGADRTAYMESAAGVPREYVQALERAA
ncbi:HD domain-containing protein [Candidatus Woesearchaeota archaeon]|jgi:hypothetical protein|nr:HD domain-containing protein [Candidatus Woesearchaeota archaeon]MBT3538259.1 HD domain-containing protein [Candidatus Woesearchaeota archaeon]MBT4697163.1 HD domain-containing protein [Candidatus Woesearchaeota archaeon]MBT4717425.1 HD domain-containing protein [Candidatus Woesearchaeota archaeon]MBT7105928.1 HD domain-containing protein [Candidatus Woesearchaeota archaeon]